MLLFEIKYIHTDCEQLLCVHMKVYNKLAIKCTIKLLPNGTGHVVGIAGRFTL